MYVCSGLPETRVVAGVLFWTVSNKQTEGRLPSGRTSEPILLQSCLASPPDDRRCRRRYPASPGRMNKDDCALGVQQAVPVHLIGVIVGGRVRLDCGGLGGLGGPVVGENASARPGDRDTGRATRRCAIWFYAFWE